MEIINEKKNPFMERTELLIEIEHAGKATPTRAEIRKQIADRLKKKEDNIEIKNIFSKQGLASSVVKVYAWDKKEVPLKKPKKAPESKDSGYKTEADSSEGNKGATEEAKPAEAKPEAKEEAKPKSAPENKEEDVKEGV